MTDRATLDHAVVAGGGADAARVLRQLARFGVRRVTLLGDAAARDAALPVTMAVVPGGDAVTLDAPALVADGAARAEANIARLLADVAAEGPGGRGRVLRDAAGAFGGVAAVGAGARVAAAAPFAGLEDAPATRVEGPFGDLAAADAARPALFLDRDGVLNHDHAYVGTRERWEWVAGAREAVRCATDHGWHVFVVTNQSGVARGFYSAAAAEALLDWAADECRRAGGTIDDWRYCPYLPDAPLAEYRRESDWRKPGPGMLDDLVRAWGLDPRRCLMVGDRASDVAAGHAAGMAAARFGGGDLLDFVRPFIAGGGLPKGTAPRT